MATGEFTRPPVSAAIIEERWHHATTDLEKSEGEDWPTVINHERLTNIYHGLEDIGVILLDEVGTYRGENGRGASQWDRLSDFVWNTLGGELHDRLTAWALTEAGELGPIEDAPLDTLADEVEAAVRKARHELGEGAE